MKTIIRSTLLSFIFISLTLPTLAVSKQQKSGNAGAVSESSLVIPLLDDIESVENTGPQKRMNVEKSTRLNDTIHHYSARVRSDRLIGNVLIYRDFRTDWIELSWDLSSISNLYMEVQTPTSTEVITITPVVFTNSGENPESVETIAHIPESLAVAFNLILASDEKIVQLLPDTISALIGNQSPTGGQTVTESDDLSLNNTEEWGCGLTCGGVIGSGALTVVSGGSLSPGLILGAAACGSCMGFIWGPPPTAQGPIDLGPGTEGHAGSIFPPLPPGWVWGCVQASYGRHSCEPIELSLD